MRRGAVATFAVIALGVFVAPLSAQAPRLGTFTGKVLTDSTEFPIPGATVSIEQLKIETMSDSAGHFVLRGIPAGNYVVSVRRVGFSPITSFLQFAAGETVDADLLLVATSSQVLPGVKVEAKAPVTGKMAEFEERRLGGFGRFMTQEDLEKRNLSVMSSALRMIPGIEVQGKGRDQWISAGRMSQPGGALQRATNVPCPVAIVLDGIFVYGAGANEAKFAIDQINPNVIAGIEFYVGPATMPIKYNATRATCGLLILWTK
jgi:hypothetical protein